MRTKIKSNDLNEYDASLFDEEQKKIFKICLISSGLILILLILFFIFSFISLAVVIGYIIGTFLSMILFYHIIKVIKEHNPLDYQKATKKMRMMHQFIYIFLLIGIYFLFRNIWSVVSCIIGLLMIRFSIFIYGISSRRGKKENV